MGITPIHQNQAESLVTDLEIEAETVRYARAAKPGIRACDILGYLQEDFPEVDEQRLKKCMVRAAVRLEAQHRTS